MQQGKPESRERGTHGRLLTVVLAGIIGVAIVGYVVGTRPAEAPSMAGVYDDSAAVDGEATEAVPYRGMRLRSRGVHATPTSDFAELRRELPAVDAPIRRDAEQMTASVVARAGGRAYDGAPPMVPHPINQLDSWNCLACHRDGAIVQGRLAPPVSHALYQSCTQCHASIVPVFGDPAVTATNSFAGLPSPGTGDRAWTGAPPVIPHKLHMRETCSACHGVAGRPGLRTTHPERRSCRQCHAARDSRDELPWLVTSTGMWP